MASITSLMSSSGTGKYSNVNSITGLASGLDTESLIETAVSGYEKKIESLYQDRTTLEWEQEAYRSIVSKLNVFTESFASYTSNTNLLENSFYNSAVDISPSGTYANLISVSGKSDNTVEVLGVKQLATAAKYDVAATFDSSETLGGIFGTDADGKELVGMTQARDEEGNLLTDSDGNALYEFSIGGFTGQYTANTKISQIMGDINNSDAGVTLRYSQTLGQFQFSAKETGTAGNEAMKNLAFNDMAKKLFGDPTDKVEDGVDAVVKLRINGIETEEEYSSNDINVDGLQIGLKGTFNYENDSYVSNSEAVTFDSKVDSSKVVETVKSMIEQYNALAEEIKNAYSTRPLTDSRGERYEPLTESEEAELSDTAIEDHNEKAKTGILFGDSDLNSLYSSLRSTISSMSVELSEIGISTVYKDGLTTLKLDEDKLASAMEEDPTRVKEILGGDSDTTGVMQSFKETMDKYAKTTGATKGILVEKAGHELAPTSMLQNTLQSKLDDLDEKIERWRDKIATKVDYYTKQFTMLEQLISQMNSQSSALAGLSGGY